MLAGRTLVSRANRASVDGTLYTIARHHTAAAARHEPEWRRQPGALQNLLGTLMNCLERTVLSQMVSWRSASSFAEYGQADPRRRAMGARPAAA
jgi:hypothetical protein